MPQTTGYDCDVAIVGSGIAGALIGWKLAQAGAKVVILDSGPTVNRAEGLALAFSSMASSVPDATYKANPWAPKPATLDPNNYLVQTGPDPFVSNYERVVGGTTWHWLGTALRLIPSDFRLKSTYGVGEDWPLDYDDLDPGISMPRRPSAWRATTRRRTAPLAPEPTPCLPTPSPTATRNLPKQPGNLVSR